jgi:cobalt/nickel transport system permease protein
MHIPDGFLSSEVWLTLDLIAIPSVAWLARRAQNEFDHHRIPMMGVMGSFIFAAQMINFPLGNGASGHLLGGALLSMTLGPAAASIVMTAILAIQALIFQDGGVLALGANVVNMALAGVLAGYLPSALLGRRKSAIFLGGMLSLMTSAVLALAELLCSGVKIPAPLFGLSLALFAAAAVIEGAVTLAVVQALDQIQPGLIRRPRGPRARILVSMTAVTVLMAGTGFFLASTQPDGIQKLALETGLSARITKLAGAPLAEYKLQLLSSAWQSKALAGLIGIFLVYVICIAVSRALLASRPATTEKGA